MFRKGPKQNLKHAFGRCGYLSYRDVDQPVLSRLGLACVPSTLKRCHLSSTESKAYQPSHPERRTYGVWLCDETFGKAAKMEREVFEQYQPNFRGRTVLVLYLSSFHASRDHQKVRLDDPDPPAIVEHFSQVRG